MSPTATKKPAAKPAPAPAPADDLELTLENPGAGDEAATLRAQLAEAEEAAAAALAARDDAVARLSREKPPADGADELAALRAEVDALRAREAARDAIALDDDADAWDPNDPRLGTHGALLRKRDHLEGCPVYGDVVKEADRVECYEVAPVAGPLAKAYPRAEVITMTRCKTCGVARALPGGRDENLSDPPLTGGITL